MTIQNMKISVLGLFLGACACSVYAQTSNVETVSFDPWKNPDFQKRFTESYIAETDIEPTVTDSERKIMLQVLELMDSNDVQKAKTLLEKNNNEAASAVFDFTLANLNFQFFDDPNLAMQGYEKAVKKHYKFRRAWNHLGIIYFQQTEYTKAIEALTRVIEGGGGNVMTFVMLGFSNIQLKDYLAAESAFRMAILLEPTNLEWREKLIYALYMQGRYAEVRSMCDLLIEKNPSRADLWMLQANAFLGMNQPLKAAVNFEMVDSLDASTADSLNMLADIYVNQEMFSTAVDTYVRALKIKPLRNTDRAVRAAQVLSAKGALGETKRLIEQIETLHGNLLGTLDKKTLLRLSARIAAAEGADEEEIRVLEEIVALDPLDGEALILLGRYYSRKDEPEKAVAYYERAESLEKYEADAKVRHAQLLVSQGKYVQAVALLTQAQKLKYRDDVQTYLEQVERVAKARS